MNYKYLILIFFLFSCTTNNVKKSKDIVFKDSYSNKGFTLIYDDSLKKKKIISKKNDERSLIIFQKNLTKGTTVKITNLINNKSILVKVGAKSNYPEFYNSVISKRIYKKLEIDKNEPYIEILEISKNSTFLAKKAKTFDEEKKVADKAPVDDISINNLSKDSIYYFSNQQIWRELYKKVRSKSKRIKIIDNYGEPHFVILPNK